MGLKPCPLCGPSAVCVVRLDAPFGVKCKCGLCGAEAFDGHWNTRPIEDALRAEIAALKAELARWKKPLTAEEEFAMWDKWQVADEDNHPVLFLDRAMAAIRAAREGGK